MKLYHFTKQDCLPGIRQGGLIAHQPDFLPRFVTIKPVVWLTDSNDTLCWMTNRKSFPCRLMVTLPKNKRLAHFATWMKRQGHSKVLQTILEEVENSGGVAACSGWLDHWYVHFGTIPASRISEG